MKKIFTAIYFTISVFSISVAQTTLDGSGNYQSTQQNSVALPSQPLSMMAITPYDTVRSLNEINNATDADAYPWISDDALRIYFTKSTGTTWRFYVTSRPDTSSPFTTPQILDPVFPTTAQVASCWLSPDELDFYFIKNNGLYYSHRNTLTTSFTTPVIITLTNAPQLNFGPSLDGGQNELFILGAGAISRYLRTSATSFAFSYTIPVAPGTTVGAGQLSKDGLTLFYASTSATLSEIYGATRPDTATAFSTGQPVQGLNDPAKYNSKPSMSADLEWVAFTTLTANSWQDNDLYIARKGSLPTPVFETFANKGIKLQPNPFTDELRLHVYGQLSANSTMTLYDVFGKQVLSQVLAQETTILNTKQLLKGVYFICTNISGVIYTEKLVKF